MNSNGYRHQGGEIRNLVHRLTPLLDGQPGCVLTFIAARKGEGTTTVAGGFADTLAKETGRKVLYLGANPHSERFHIEVLDHSGELIEHHNSGSSGAVQRSDTRNSIAEWTGENRGLSTRVMHNRDFWKSMKESFDVVVIDAPALESSSDGVVLASRSDKVILVVESEHTRQPVIENLRDTLLACGADIAGVVLNKRRYYIPDNVYKRL